MGHATGEIRAEHAEEHTRTLAHVLELPFSQAVHEAARFYDHHHRLPLGTSWSIHLALVCLIAHFPATIDDFVQRLKEREEHARGVLSKQHSAIKPSAEDLKAAVATVTGVPAVLSAFVAALTCFANQPDLALPLAASSSRLAFARALYGIAAWRTLGDEPAQWEEFGKCLSRYGVTEQQELLGMALYDLRVKANQERHRGLPESSRVRPLVVEALVASLSSTSSVERLVELMPFFSGPLLGSSSASTHKEILVPLVTSGTLSEHDLFEVWDKLIGKRLTDDYLSHADVELVQVWGATYWKATQTRQLDVLAEATKALEASGRSLSEPFLRSRDSARWQGAARRALWWLFRLWAIFEKSARDVTRAQLQAQVHELLHRALQLADDEALVESAVGETREFATNVLARLRSESLIVRPASEESRPSTDGSEPSTE